MFNAKQIKLCYDFIAKEKLFGYIFWVIFFIHLIRKNFEFIRLKKVKLSKIAKWFIILDKLMVGHDTTVHYWNFLAVKAMHCRLVLKQTSFGLELEAQRHLRDRTTILFMVAVWSEALRLSVIAIYCFFYAMTSTPLTVVTVLIVKYLRV